MKKLIDRIIDKFIDIANPAPSLSQNPNFHKNKEKRQDFSESVREKTLKKQGHRCADCGKLLTTTDFHHKNGNKSDNGESNCVALCPNCHADKTRRTLGEGYSPSCPPGSGCLSQPPQPPQHPPSPKFPYPTMPDTTTNCPACGILLLTGGNIYACPNCKMMWKYGITGGGVFCKIRWDDRLIPVQPPGDYSQPTETPQINEGTCPECGGALEWEGQHPFCTNCKIIWRYSPGGYWRPYNR